MLCSSAVTIAPVSFAARTMQSRSMGLMVAMSITRAAIPSFFRISAADSASPTIRPVAMMATSSPSVIRTALPISKR